MHLIFHFDEMAYINYIYNFPIDTILYDKSYK